MLPAELGRIERAIHHHVLLVWSVLFLLGCRFVELFE